LANSGSFASTHIIIAQLAKHSNFLNSQVEELVKIAGSNNQVGWIIADNDVHEFYASLLKKYGTAIQLELAVELAGLVKAGEPENSNGDSVPF
jgi:hypothetical protein